MNSPRLTPILVLSLCLVITLVGSGRQATAQTPGVYVALGDSIAGGIGSSLPRSRGNAALVVGWLSTLSRASVPLENLAVPGETAATFISSGQLEAFRNLAARANAAGVPIAAVTVSLGGNELLSLESSGLADRESGLEDFRARYREALAAIRTEIGSDVPLVVTTIYDITGGDSSIRLSDSWWIAQFNGAIRAAASERGALVADLAPLFSGRGNDYTHAPFDVHPTNAGHRVIAQAIWSAMNLDRERPRIDVLSSAVASRSTPTVRFSVDDNVGVASVAIVESDVPARGPFRIDDLDYALLLDASAVSASEVAVTIEISDDGGNQTRRSVIVAIDDMSEGVR